jgi:hypothetical protein
LSRTFFGINPGHLLWADQLCSFERHPDRASAYPNGAAAPDHTISFGHQLKPMWNIGRIGNFDCSSIGGDVSHPAARARTTDRNKSRFVDLGTRMPTSLVHVPIGRPPFSIKGKTDSSCRPISHVHFDCNPEHLHLCFPTPTICRRHAKADNDEVSVR